MGRRRNQSGNHSILRETKVETQQNEIWNINVWGAAKAALRGKLRVINACVMKQEMWNIKSTFTHRKRRTN